MTHNASSGISYPTGQKEEAFKTGKGTEPTANLSHLTQI